MAAQKLCATDPVPPREPHWCQYCCSPCWLTRWVATLASHQLQPIVTHNVSNMVVAVWEASMAPHIACFAHTVNLAAQKLLDIPQVQRLLGRIRRVVSFFHKSTMATHLCEKQKLLDKPSHKLISDVKTRWNSTYDMVARYVEQQWGIAATLQCPELQKQSVNTLNNTYVILAQLLLTVLEPLKTVTVIMCNEHQPTLSMVWPLLHNFKEAMRMRDENHPEIL